MRFGFLLLSLLVSASSFAGEVKPVVEGTKASELAGIANSILGVNTVRAGGLTYQFVTMDTALNGDIGTTTILLVGNEVGGAAGYDNAYELSPREGAVQSVRAVGAVEATKNSGVMIEVTSGEDLQTTKKFLTYDQETQKLTIMDRK